MPSVPMNALDLARMRKVLDLMEEHKKGEVSIYVDGGYVQVSAKAHGLNADELRRVFTASIEELWLPKEP